MKLIVGALVLTLATFLVAASPHSNPLDVVSEARVCGWECIPDDGCLGIDEGWSWSAGGVIRPGETFIYVPPEPPCGHRIVTAHVSYKGKAGLVLTLEDISSSKVFQTHGVRRIDVCTSGFRYEPYTVELTNVGKQARDVWLGGSDYGWGACGEE